jgi:hypothetical protein
MSSALPNPTRIAQRFAGGSVWGDLVSFQGVDLESEVQNLLDILSRYGDTFGDPNKYPGLYRLAFYPQTYLTLKEFRQEVSLALNEVGQIAGHFVQNKDQTNGYVPNSYTLSVKKVRQMLETQLQRVESFSSQVHADVLRNLDNYIQALTDSQGKVEESRLALVQAVRGLPLSALETYPSLKSILRVGLPDSAVAGLDSALGAMEDLRKRLNSPTKTAMLRTAGEVRFIKDKSGDASQWAWGDTGPQERKITPDFAFDPKNTKPLARVMRSTNAAMGHAMAAYAIFTKIKSADVSPDGSLGGKGYIQKIAEMRRAYMNVVEALSAMSDTLYDEIRAPHWAAVSRQENPSERKEVEQIVGDALEIKQDPEGWAKQEEAEMDEENEISTSKKSGK